jgi:Ca2+-binding RTX toxin-like protein
MWGGLGDDTYVVDSSLDKANEAAGGGTDLVRASASFTLGAEVENLTLTGTAAINGTGNGLANTLIGNGEANTLDGKAGADIMVGGAGNDTYVVDDAGDLVSDSGATGGTDLVRSAVSFTLGLNVENLTLTGSAAANATGNGLDNIILGNAGANILDGKAGADGMTGGAGDDTYIIDNTGDVAIETNAAHGVDTVRSGLSYTLGSNIENLVLTGPDAIDGTGNSAGNILTGNGAANVLKGMLGNDTLEGGGGADTLIGGTGNDLLEGNAGADSFVFESELDASTNVDHVVDFAHLADKLVLENARFSGLAAGALSANAFVVGTAAADANDRIIYDVATGALYFDMDGTGAAAQFQFATLDNMPANLSASDFLVI